MSNGQAASFLIFLNISIFLWLVLNPTGAFIKYNQSSNMCALMTEDRTMLQESTQPTVKCTAL